MRIISILRALRAACLMLPLLPAVSLALEVSFPAPANEVPGHAGLTYLDLVRLIVPDLAQVDEAGDTYEGRPLAGLRHIAGPDRQDAPPEKVGLAYLNALNVRSNGQDRLLLLLDLGQAAESAERFAVLALYDLTNRPRLLDAANVAFDRFTAFYEPARIAIGEGEDVVITISEHINSSQSYVTTALILVHKDKLELIDSIFTFDDRACTFQRTQDIAFEPVGGGTYAAI